MKDASAKAKNKTKTGATKTRRVKTKALVVFEHAERLLLAEYRDKQKQPAYYRPLGGSILYGERSEDAARREVR